MVSFQAGFPTLSNSTYFSRSSGLLLPPVDLTCGRSVSGFASLEHNGKVAFDINSPTVNKSDDAGFLFLDVILPEIFQVESLARYYSILRKVS